MPGRLAIFEDKTFKADLLKSFNTFEDTIQVLHKKYNIAPTIHIPIFTNRLQYTYAHFGLIPSWAKSRDSLNINARSESIYEKASFKEAYRQRRCLIPVNGYYEWIKDGTTKKSIPYLISNVKKNYFAFAGVYEYWYDNEQEQSLLTTALITTEPNEKVATIHDRMPVILEQKDWAKWLDNSTPFSELNKLFIPCSSEIIDINEVGDLVNSVRNDSVECLEKTSRIKVTQGTLF